MSGDRTPRPSTDRAAPYYDNDLLIEVNSKSRGNELVQDAEGSVTVGTKRRRSYVATNLARLPSHANLSRYPPPPWLQVPLQVPEERVAAVHPPTPPPSAPRPAHRQLPNAVDYEIRVSVGMDAGGVGVVDRSTDGPGPQYLAPLPWLQVQTERAEELPLLCSASPAVPGWDLSDAALGLDESAFGNVDWVMPGFMRDISHPHVPLVTQWTPTSLVSPPPIIPVLPQWPIGTGPLPIPPPRKSRTPKQRARQRSRPASESIPGRGADRFVGERSGSRKRGTRADAWDGPLIPDESGWPHSGIG